MVYLLPSLLLPAPREAYLVVQDIVAPVARVARSQVEHQHMAVVLRP